MMLMRRAATRLVPMTKLQRPSKWFSSTKELRSDFTHAVIGAGVVGLAVAQRLAQAHPGASVVLIERHEAPGTETSSRNSEVIHAGIYYGPGTLKTRLCVRGRELLYAFCEARGVAARRTGKWIVAQTEGQREALEGIRAFCEGEIGVPMRWVGGEEVRREGEGVRAAMGALESPMTGIVDSHGFMVCLRGLFEEAGGIVALRSPVTGVRPVPGGGVGEGASTPGSLGWEIDVEVLDGGGETSTITADTVVNAAGLGAAAIHNMIKRGANDEGDEPPLRLYYAKGNYFTYASPQPRISRLIYPAPEPGAAGLGTHLTLDLSGRIRFGPDVEWVDDPTDLAVGTTRLAAAVAEIRKYLPSVDGATLVPDYAGIRPKLAYRGAVAEGSGFQDFVIRRERGYEGWVNLLGIESPGLTSSLAIAEMVDDLLYRR